MKKTIFKALVIIGIVLLVIIIAECTIAYIDSPRGKKSSDYYYHISEPERQSFNQQWNTYEGAQGGNNVKALLQKIIANCNTNAQEDQRLVDVQFGRTTIPAGSDLKAGISTSAGFTESRLLQISVNGTAEDGPGKYADIADNTVYKPEAAVKAINVARNGIEARHTYTIEISYSASTSLVDKIIIMY